MSGSWVKTHDFRPTANRALHEDKRDDGILVSYDARWICLEKSFGERIYFPISNARLLKPSG